jgi:IS5 family transposase
MLRIHFMQHWFTYSDPAMEEALHDIPVLRAFAGLDAAVEAMPDETTILKFRHLLERHGLAPVMLDEINAVLIARGLLLRQGTMVDATLIAAPTSTKNRTKKRDPEMSSTKKGNQWYFGMKAHIGVDSQTKLIHSVAATAANAHDSQLLGDLLHGGETRVWGDSAYAGQGETIREQAPDAKDFTNKKGSRNRPLSDEEKTKNKTKSKVRAKVEHPFLILKRVFGFTKVRYRGLEKNAARLFVACGLVNLYMARRRLLRATEGTCV